jgi:hypothetical protein
MKGNFAVIGMLLKIPTLLIFCTLYSISANATPVVWNLSGVTFEDGGTASGSFTYDADTGTYSAISISTTAGTAITIAMDYDVTNAGCLTLDEIICFLNVADGPDYTDDLGVTFAWLGTPLTNAGGTVTLTGGREYTCENATCATVGAPLRLLDAGSITTNPAAPTYSVGGTVSGLTGSVTLFENTSGEDLALSTNGSFAFATEQVDGTPYAVTVLAQPTGQTCSITNGSGTITTADVTNVSVACEDDVVVLPPAPMVPVPAMSEWALILLTMLLCLMVFANRKRLL